ncbi:SCP2 sterol-binding domain-containing protein [Nocardioides nanhaiensis]|uniref:SCP2 domain-containing protein n=1 Tax=Nocardioides nanhaiensis TaxID=1476871 RepID=A0ABP8WH88_9ACTN
MPRDLTARPLEPTATATATAPAAARLARVVEDLPRRLLPERLEALRGAVLVRAHHEGRDLEPVVLLLDAGVRTVPGADAAGPDVVLRCELDALEALTTGITSAGLLLLGGRLEVEGDLDLALGLAGSFRSAADPQVAVEPVALEASEVARVLGTVPVAHLVRIMGSDLRGVVLEEIFRQLPERLSLRRARGTRLCVGFRLLGHPAGVIERYEVLVAEGRAVVTRLDDAAARHDGTDGAGRDATVTCQAHDFLRLATGHLRPVTAVMRGQLKVRGDRGHALRLASLIDIPQA